MLWKKWQKKTCDALRSKARHMGNAAADKVVIVYSVKGLEELCSTSHLDRIDLSHTECRGNQILMDDVQVLLTYFL